MLQAQITETGTKVGINNTSPDASLDIRGNDGTLMKIKAVGEIVNDNSGTRGFTMAPDGKVGIGTDNLSNDFNGNYEVFI